MEYRIILDTGPYTNMGKFPVSTEDVQGLDDFDITLKRHEKYSGIFPEITGKIELSGLARDFLWSAWQEQGINALVNINIDTKRDGQDDFYNFYSGRVDFRDVEFSCDTAKLNLKSSNPVDLFLSRADQKFNLQDNPCVITTTYDKTERTIRYQYAPYDVTFADKEIIGVTKWELLPDSTFANVAFIENNLYVYSQGVPTNDKVTLCNNEPGFICQSDDDKCQDHVNANVNDPMKNDSLNCAYFPDGRWAIANTPPLINVNDDLQISTNAYFPQNNASQYARKPGSNSTNLCDNVLPFPTNPTQQSFEEPWDFGVDYASRNQYIGEARCGCCIDSCTGYRIIVDAELTVDTCPDVRNGIIDWFCIAPAIEVRWGNYVYIHYLRPPSDIYNCPEVDGSGCQANFENSCAFNPTTYTHFDGTVQFEIDIPACEVFEFDRLYVYNRNFITFRGGETVSVPPLFNGKLARIFLPVRTTFKKFDITVISSDCVGEYKRVGPTQVSSFMVHEALTRTVEHYTNNELRVKSCVFQRHNSFAGSNDLDFQERNSCDQTVPPTTCLEAKIYPDTPYQSTADQPALTSNIVGAYAWTVITSGMKLRDFGKDLFTSFEELFDALDSLYCIGAGYSYADPGNIRVDHKSFFYTNDMVLNLEVDFNEVDAIWEPASDMMYGSIETGYNKEPENFVNTIDEFNGKRVYNTKARNINKGYKRVCPYNASGYSIEWMRRQRIATKSDNDDDIYIVCVGKSIDVNNEIQLDYPAPTGTITVPWNMFHNEQGMEAPFLADTQEYPTASTRQLIAPNGIISPETTYNWRISPYYNACRQRPVLMASFFGQSGIDDEIKLKFAKGSGNYTSGGREIMPNNQPFSGIDYNYDTNTKLTHVELQDVDYEENSDLATFPLSDKKIGATKLRLKTYLGLFEFNAIRVNPYGIIYVNNVGYRLQKISYRIDGKSDIELISID